MKELLKKGLAIGLGLAITSKEQAEKLVDELVKKGDLTKSESREFLSELVEKGEQSQKELDQIIGQKLNQILTQLNIATKEDVQRLEQRIEQLEMEHRSSNPAQ